MRISASVCVRFPVLFCTYIYANFIVKFKQYLYQYAINFLSSLSKLQKIGNFRFFFNTDEDEISI